MSTNQFNLYILKFDDETEKRFMMNHMSEDLYGFKLMFGSLMFINPILIFLDVSRFEDPTNSIGLRFMLELVLISVFIISHRIKKYEILKYQGFFFISTILIYLFLLASDYVMGENYYQLFLPNVTTLTIIINASFIGLRFRHSALLNLYKIVAFSIYANLFSTHALHKEQTVYLIVFYIVVTILSYLFERKNRELFLNELLIAEKKALIEKKNDALNKENEIKDTLLSILSHDVRGPLLTLESLLALNKDNLMSEKEIQKHLQLLSKSVNTIRQFTDRTIVWIKSQMDGFKVTNEKFNVNTQIAETIELIEHSAQEKEIQIECKISGFSELTTDKEMFNIVIRNLLTNAIKFSHANSTITIREKSDLRYYKLFVDDEGVGIPEDKKTTLFSLETLSSDGTRKEKGTGLGLPLASNLMRQLDGNLSFISNQDQGSTFIMEFILSVD